ncbi:hypothetical protein BSKO_08559 [Bryopsis sp. KO-2023]|nr:hypothetical protein BSKO_08559 [Bryopsis sp. KO-2023]
MSGSITKHHVGGPSPDDETNAVRLAVERLQNADSQLENCQREREQALRELRNIGSSAFDSIHSNQKMLQSSPAASDVSFPDSVRERARLARQSIDEYLDVENIAAINSINSLAEAKSRGEELMRAAESRWLELEEWKQNFSANLIENHENMRKDRSS